MDLWLENNGKATATTRIAVTTSTATSLASDNTTILDTDSGGLIMAGLGNAFGPDGATPGSETATSSLFGWFNYPGTDTRVASQLGHLKIPSTTNILVYVTGTDSLVTSTWTNFGGYLHIIGREVKR